ncbi:MAG: hypothetical protein ACREBC_07940 [Pyrinomonadaceae bacterium]
MRQENAESFIRWQAATQQHFTSTANLLLGLATGLLAFESTLLLDARFLSHAAFWFAVAAVVFLFTSVGVALWCAINRLRDFRLSAQIARRRQEDEPSLQKSREEAKSLGNFTWGLFWFQVGMFGVGAGCVAIAVVVQIWP